MSETRSLFERNLKDFDKLPYIIRDMHDVEVRVEALGLSNITRGESWLSNLVANLFGFPKAGENQPIRVVFERHGDSESLLRDYGKEKFISHFADHPEPGVIYETFGPLWFEVECVCSEQGIDMDIRSCRLWNKIPIPLFFLPRTDATERVSGGKYQFDVDISLPLIGRVIWYKGVLKKIS